VSQAFDHIVQQLDKISQQEKDTLREILDQSLAAPNGNKDVAPTTSAFGWAKGRITLSDDFDAPLDDFKEYIE
jgi:hypothetical protein